MNVFRPIVFKSLLQITVACILIILGLELSARLILPEYVAQWRETYFGIDPRYGFISRGALQNKDGYFNFHPNTTIHIISYYPDSSGNPTPEYNCSYRSDDLGFISNIRNYQEANILILGDSFTQGDGGCEWIPRLDPDVRSQVYSTGVMGLGVLHWNNIISDLAQLKQPKRILLIFITDDFFRTDWVYSRRQIECVDDHGNCQGAYWYPIAGDLGAIATKRVTERYQIPGIMNSLKYHLIATYSLYRILTSKSPDEDRVFIRSMDVVSKLAKKYDIKLLWVNERADSKRTSPRAQAIARRLRDLKEVSTVQCNIPTNNFLPRDPHPNAAGYDVLKDCVERLVRSW